MARAARVGREALAEARAAERAADVARDEALLGAVTDLLRATYEASRLAQKDRQHRRRREWAVLTLSALTFVAAVLVPLLV